jgi:hypothetical protein
MGGGCAALHALLKPNFFTEPGHAVEDEELAESAPAIGENPLPPLGGHAAQGSILQARGDFDRGQMGGSCAALHAQLEPNFSREPGHAVEDEVVAESPASIACKCTHGARHREMVG